MTLESIWLGAKIMFLVAIVTAGAIVGRPVIDKIVSLLDKKEQLYNEQIVRLSDNSVSQRIESSNQLLQMQIKGLSDELVSLARKRDQDIVAMGTIVASLRQDFREQVGNSYKDKQDSSKDYEEAVINKQLPNKDQIPWAWAMYSPNIKGENKWTTGTYPVDIHTKVALGKNKDRSDAYVEAYMTSDVFNKDKGKKFPLSISSVEWVEAPPKEKEWMYNPRVSLGLGVARDFFSAIEVSLFSYGRTKGDMDWRFLGIGAGVSSDNQYIYIAPVEYNVGKKIPLVDNLFISPFLGADKDSATWGIQLQIPF